MAEAVAMDSYEKALREYGDAVAAAVTHQFQIAIIQWTCLCLACWGMLFLFAHFREKWLERDD